MRRRLGKIQRYSYLIKYLFPAILVLALSERLSAQPDPQTPYAAPPDDGIIVRDANGQPVPPSPVQPVYTLKSGNVHSDFFNGSLKGFTLDGLGFYLAPGRYSIEVIHRNDQDPPKDSTHSSPPFKGELATPRFQFEALPHPNPGWGKPVRDLELTVSSVSHKVAVGDPIALQGTIRNMGSEQRSLPDTHWNYLARAYLDDPNGGRFREQKMADRDDNIWTRKPRVLEPGESHSFSYSTEGFAFRNKHIGWKCERMSEYLVLWTCSRPADCRCLDHFSATQEKEEEPTKGWSRRRGRRSSALTLGARRTRI